ncbi:MAG: hypothetical protein RLY71_626 [Pseudomonadota bacterium]|jgi:hypothetical protein
MRSIRPLLRTALGTASLVVFASTATSAHAIDIVFDYSYDTSGFFTDTARRNLLDSAAYAFESRLTDNLTAITSGSGGTFNVNFFNPSDAYGANVSLNSFSVAAGELRIFVGGGDLGSGTLGLGGGGGWGASGTSAFLNNARSRGQDGALTTPKTDLGPWGGSVSFNNTSNWYFDTNSTTTESFSGYDFYSVAVHEIAHVLGMGTSASWDAHVTGSTFVGTASGTHELSAGLGHWAEGTMSDVNGVAQETAMDPNIAAGQRKYMTSLDYAGMQDIGWHVAPVTAVPEPATMLLWSAGLGLFGLRRRTGQQALKA